MKKKNGFFLLESIVAIVVFAVGIVGIVQYQNTVLQSTSDAYNRITATYLAESIIGQITIDKPHLSDYVGGVSTNVGYTSWLNAVKGNLPKVASNLPTITSSTVNGATQLTILIKWQSPFNPTVSSYSTQVVIF